MGEGNVLPAAAEAFLAESRNVVIAGTRSDGSPSITPNWFLWEDGRFYISTTKTRAKYRMFRRDPRVQLLVDDATGHRYVRVDGRAEFWDDLDATLPYFRRIRSRYGREMGPDAEAKAELQKEDRVLMIVTPTAAPQTVGLGR